METTNYSIPNGASATLINTDSHAYKDEVIDQFDYDAVLTSPPYPDRKKGKFGVNWADDGLWAMSAYCMADYCANAKGINGVVGFLDLPAYISQENREKFEEHLKDNGLKSYIINARRTVQYGKPINYNWWIVYRKSMSHADLRLLLSKKPDLETALDKESNISARGFCEVWNSRVDIDDTPDQFCAAHTQYILDKMIGAGATILDPYMGTGYGPQQALLRDINAVGIEIEQPFFAATKYAFETHLLPTAQRIKKIKRSQTKGSSKTESVVDYYTCQYTAEADGLYTKKRCEALGVPPSSRSRSRHTLRTPGRGRPAILYWVPERYLVKS